MNHVREKTHYCRRGSRRRQPEHGDLRSSRASFVAGCLGAEKLAHSHREVIPERRTHVKGSGIYGTNTVTHDITRYTRAKIFSRSA